MKLFVWDFHGVLEKDNDLAVLEISNKVLEEAGFSERFSEEDNKKFYGLKWYEYFERILPSLTSEEHMALQSACFKFAEKNLDVLAKHIKPNDNAVNVLKAISDAGHDQILLSNTRPHDLLWFINTVGLSDYLPAEKVFGVNAHEKHGNKQDALKDYLKSKNYSGIVIIGDSEADMDLARIGGGTTYYYTHPHIKTSNKVRADYSINNLTELLRELDI